ncbi:winged helix-turn-helix domain-containing protein [Actinomadura kijaniata]|uniref:DNA-binding transcriptional ArsR family regulator n=1 Tax=Actinomadura namibiensis TaxID=182080 RepID=A0A7W3LPE9_ACTNM|nr:winged helix-turn-helix domain-containing protein [Actinomadura namibiensis]MBA8951859.1 DNA-binding transcriptional ArsR family regulator [Actinomadura namibiensis]
MLSIHFTADDLARIRVSGARPAWETVLSARSLRDRARHPVLGSWRARTLEVMPAASRMLLALCPPAGRFAEFLISERGAREWEGDLDAILGTPPDRIRNDLVGLAWRGRPPEWAAALAAGEGKALHALGRALRDYHRIGIAPYWEEIQARVEVDRAFRLRVLADGGVEQLLATLDTAVRWDSGTLELPQAGERRVRLDGRGVVLAPSVFCGRQAVIRERSDRPPVLFFPVVMGFGRPLAVTGGDDRRPDALSALLGRTRAAALQEAADGTTTTELARRLEVGLSTASEHVKVLREAGLIATGRMGREAVHTVTPLGAALSRTGCCARPSVPDPGR